MTSGDPAGHSKPELEESGETTLPPAGLPATATEHVAVTDSSAGKQYVEDRACGFCSGSPRHLREINCS